MIGDRSPEHEGMGTGRDRASEDGCTVQESPFGILDISTHTKENIHQNKKANSIIITKYGLGAIERWICNHKMPITCC